MGIDIAQLQQVLFDNEHRDKSLWGFPTADVLGDAGEILETVVYVLKHFDRISNWTIPINGAELPEFNFGTMSYPTFAWNQVLNYPDIGLLYAACNRANVTCQHVFLSRDPYAIVSSTVRRSFHSVQLSSHLYSTMLAVIHKQLVEFPGRTAACWQYEEANDAWQVGKLLGWQNRESFEQTYSSVYKSTPDQNLRSKFPSSLMPYMNSMERTTNLVMGVCRNVQNKCIE